MQLKPPPFFLVRKSCQRQRVFSGGQSSNISYSFLSLDFQSNYCEQCKKHYFLVMAIQEIGEQGKMIKAIGQFAREPSGVP